MNYVMYLILIGIFYLLSTDDIMASIFIGVLATGVFLGITGNVPLDIIGIHLDGVYFLLNFAVFIVLSYAIGKLKNKKENSDDSSYISSNIDSPLEILGFGSHNNLFTAGNNSITFKVRNNSGKPLLFDVELLVGDKWKSSGYNDLEIEANSIQTYNILGPAWRKAKDIRISSWR